MLTINETIEIVRSDGYVKTVDMDGHYIHVGESYAEIKQLIEDVGCLVHKADPRLDTEHPLTMDNLMTMEGEPVWNSNIGEWGLVVKDPEWKGEIQAGYYLRYADGTISRFDEEDLKKFPLYRTRKAGKN